MSRGAVPQKIRQAIMRHYSIRKLEIRGHGDDQTAWGWGDLLDPTNIEEEHWRCLGPLRLVKTTVMRNFDPDYRPEDDL